MGVRNIFVSRGAGGGSALVGPCPAILMDILISRSFATEKCCSEYGSVMQVPDK